MKFPKNPSYYKDVPRINIRGHNIDGEKRRNRLMRWFRRSESLERIKNNPLNIGYIALLVSALVALRHLVDIAKSYIAETSLGLAIIQLFHGIVASVVATAELNEIQAAELQYLSEAGAWQAMVASIINTTFILFFMWTLWRGLLPWLGRPRMPKAELTELEDKLAGIFGYDISRSRYYNRPFLIAINNPERGSDVEEYVFWSGDSLDKWNKPEIKSEVLTALGGTEAEKFSRPIVKGGSKRKLKELSRVVVVCINPGAAPVSREGLRDDDI